MRVFVCLLSALALSQAAYDYKLVLRDSLLFYEAQRSGKLPSDQKVTWRKDSALNDKGQKGEDLTGGYYDAGDHVKFGFPMAFSTTVLAWGIVDYEAGYSSANALTDARKAIKWATDYFIKAHVSTNEFYGQVGLGQPDHDYWGRPEDMTMARPAFKIDTAHPVRIWQARQPPPSLLLQSCSRVPTPTIPKPCSPTPSSYLISPINIAANTAIPSPMQATFTRPWDYKDELVWGAAWLYRATGDSSYLTTAESLYKEFGIQYWNGDFGWDTKTSGVQVLLADLTGKQEYKDKVQSYCDYMINSQTKTPKGLVYVYEWGALRAIANAVYICLEAADLGINTATYRQFAKKQIDYILGDGGRSYVVGFGNNPPTSPHHRSSSCPDAPQVCDWNTFNSAQPNYHVLTGALVGGPDVNDNYVDTRKDAVHNEVATDYNAGFQSAVAAFVQLKL